MSTFGVQVSTNGPGGETYKALLVIYRCDICGQLFDNDFAEQHAGVHELRKAFVETQDESNGVVTVPAELADQIAEASKEEFEEAEGENG